MAFNNYRDIIDKCIEVSLTPKLDIERFAYDVFAYTLPMCGFPIDKVPTTARNENSYVKANFIMNVGLSVLPFALSMREFWKHIFEESLEEFGFKNILEIEYFLEKTLKEGPDYDNEDTLRKIQFSLALCNEMILFCNYKGIETYFDILPKAWSQFFSKLIKESDTIVEPLATALIMDPDVTESWITDFIRNKAIPYGSSEDVSGDFCVNFVEKFDTIDLMKNLTEEESVVLLPDASKERSLPEDSNSGSYFVPRTWDYQA